LPLRVTGARIGEGLKVPVSQALNFALDPRWKRKNFSNRAKPG